MPTHDDTSHLDNNTQSYSIHITTQIRSQRRKPDTRKPKISLRPTMYLKLVFLYGGVDPNIHNLRPCTLNPLTNNDYRHVESKGFKDNNTLFFMRREKNVQQFESGCFNILGKAIN